jgi:hypothetical protein
MLILELVIPLYYKLYFVISMFPRNPRQDNILLKIIPNHSTKKSTHHSLGIVLPQHILRSLFRENGFDFLTSSTFLIQDLKTWVIILNLLKCWQYVSQLSPNAKSRHLCIISVLQWLSPVTCTQSKINLAGSRWSSTTLGCCVWLWPACHTASKAGSDGRNQVNIGCGHPI